MPKTNLPATSHNIYIHIYIYIYIYISSYLAFDLACAPRRSDAEKGNQQRTHTHHVHTATPSLCVEKQLVEKCT